MTFFYLGLVAGCVLAWLSRYLSAGCDCAWDERCEVCKDMEDA